MSTIVLVVAVSYVVAYVIARVLVALIPERFMYHAPEQPPERAERFLDVSAGHAWR